MKKLSLPVLLSLAMCLPTFAQITFTDLTTYSQNFNGIGGEDVTPTPDSDGKTAYSRTTTLPTGWRVVTTTTARNNSTFASASNATTYVGGTSLAANDKNGTWNFGATGSTDRAVGGITTNASGGARTINVMAQLQNSTGAAIKSLALSYDIEKYRKGTRGFTIQLYTSADGETWTNAGGDFSTSYDADSKTEGAEIVPINTQTVEGSFNVTFPDNGDLYLLWSISSTTGTDANYAQAFGIDNVSITPSARAIPPTYAVFINDNGTIRENFDAIGGEDVTPVADSDGKTAYSRETTLPSGWKIERNLTAPRTRGTFAAASETTMYIGGTSLASNDKNGTWNFGATGSTDRAIGGISSNIASATRCVNVMVRLYNNSKADIETIYLSYDVEKYRASANAKDFTVKLYTSEDGESWTYAGSDFCTTFAKEGDKATGAAVVPISTTTISHALNVTFPDDGILYLAWCISVESDDAGECGAAPALAIDNVAITPAPSARTTADGWASFASGLNLNIPEDVTAYQADYTADGSTETLVLTALTNGVIPANTGVLLNGAVSDVLRFTEATNAAAIAEAESEVSGNDLMASVERTILEEGYDYFCMRYSTDLGTFFQLYQGAYIPAGKAYLKIAGGSSAPGRKMRIVVKPNAPTAIEDIHDEPMHTEWTKVIRDGQLLIMRGEETITIYGTRVR